MEDYVHTSTGQPHRRPWCKSFSTFKCNLHSGSDRPSAKMSYSCILLTHGEKTPQVETKEEYHVVIWANAVHVPEVAKGDGGIGLKTEVHVVVSRCQIGAFPGRR